MTVTTPPSGSYILHFSLSNINFYIISFIVINT
jgi:hypothetical protein